MPSLTSERSTKSTFFSLAAIMLLAVILRFVGLTRDSLWTDEIYSGFASQLAGIPNVIDFITLDVHPPGYFVTLWTWARVFGDSDYSLRAFSAVGGVLLIPVVFRLGRQLYDERVGLLASLFAAVLIQGIYYSQEVRSYIWMALWSALAVSLLISYVRDQQAAAPRASWWLILATLVCVVNSYYHYFGLLFSVTLLAGLCGYFIHRRENAWPGVVSLGAVLLAFAPWVRIAVGSVGKQNWIQKPTLHTVAETANTFYGPGIALVGSSVLLIVAGFVFGLRRRRLIAADLSLFVWILVPLAAALLVSVLLRPVYSPRNMMFAFSAGCLILGRAIAFLSERPKVQWTIAILFVVALFSVHVSTGNGYLLRPVKQQVREAAHFIEENNAGRAPIYAVDWDQTMFNYYLSRTDQDPLLRTISISRAENGFRDIEETEFWVASAGIDVNLLTDLSRDYEFVKKGDFIQARAYLLRRKAK